MISNGIEIAHQTFFMKGNLFTEWSKFEIVSLASVHNEFKVRFVSGTFGLEVMNRPGLAKGFETEMTCFFSKTQFTFLLLLVFDLLLVFVIS